jgi:4-oxalocrotonate tautomerase
MPLVRISVYESTPSNQRKAIADAVYEAMRQTIGIPEGDRFIIVSSYRGDELFVDPGFMGMKRTDRFVLVQIFLGKGRTVAQKQALFAAVASGLHKAIGVDGDNVMTVLSENSHVDWSFGKGQAQYVLNPPSWVHAGVAN